MSDSEHGFTLVELLVALVLFAFLTGMLASGLDLATRRYQGQYSRLERSQRVALVENFLRSQLSGARALPDRIGPRGSVAFDGAAEQVRFVASGPESVTVGGLADLTVAFAPEESAKNGDLIVRWRSFGTAGGAPPRESVLLEHVRRVNFTYFGKTAPNEPPGWKSRWRGAELPSLVRLSLTFDNGMIMPELIVAVETATAPTE